MKYRSGIYEMPHELIKIVLSCMSLESMLIAEFAGAKADMVPSCAKFDDVMTRYVLSGRKSADPSLDRQLEKLVP